MCMVCPGKRIVRMKWNSRSVKTCTHALGLSLILCPAFDTIHGRQLLTLEERFAVAAKPKTGRRKN
ncbi:hypothetical protein SCLCIDRAFT_1219168 [Scleroderma citrinum Foug A]|uniref:Uncharacterized protein n=1 Tax=Scleroderma citrinum Foug A TaxID=1036808 RepID=A0A0C2ZZ16_9AGAM|nr:hypothetical protein SCLCIDRAFT_1219168 [Scleroderma citrinum Foug A]